jgi:tetratricopeptide (TPR) repeat protein
MFARAGCAILCLFVLGPVPGRAQTTIAAMNEAGWAALEAGDGGKAARHFADALARQPNDPVLLFGASVAAQVEGRSADAKRQLRRALDVNPRFTPASLLLGDIVYREGELGQAIGVYERALALAPGNPDLTTRLQAWRQEADVHHGFVERRYDRFRVMFEGQADEPLAVRAIDLLDAAFWRIGQTLGAYPSDTVQVILYTEKQFRDITRAPDWSAGLYDGRIRVPAAGATRHGRVFERVVVHELTHAMVAAIAPRGIPVWLHEGLAQYFEGADPGAARQRLRAGGRLFHLAQLKRGFTRLSAADAQVAYDESLLAAQAIVERSDVNWPQLLRTLAESDRAEAAFASFGISYADLEGALTR